jgi:hypothetical protein
LNTIPGTDLLTFLPTSVLNRDFSYHLASPEQFTGYLGLDFESRRDQVHTAQQAGREQFIACFHIGQAAVKKQVCKQSKHPVGEITRHIPLVYTLDRHPE